MFPISKNLRFLATFFLVLGISAFATIRSQTHLDLVRNVQLVGYVAILVMTLMSSNIAIPVEAWLLFLAPASQAIGYFKTGNALDATTPLEIAFRTLVIVGILPQMVDKKSNLKPIVLGLLMLAAVNYYESQGRYEISLLADNRVYSNMMGGYGMIFGVVGFCLAGWIGMACVISGGLILLLTSCRSATLATIVGCIIPIIFRFREFDRKFVRFIFLMLLCAPFIAYLAWHHLDEDSRDSIRMQMDHFMSHDAARSDKWNTATTSGFESPWLGLGRYTADSEDAHNIWLSAFVAGGIVPVILLMLSQLLIFRKLYPAREEYWGCLSLAWFMAILTRSIFEGGTGIFPATGFNWAGVCAMFLIGIGFRHDVLSNQQPKPQRRGLSRLRYQRRHAFPRQQI